MGRHPETPAKAMKDMDRPQSAWTQLSESGKPPGDTSTDGAFPAKSSSVGTLPPSVEKLPAPVLVVDAEGGLLYQNSATKELVRAFEASTPITLLPDDFKEQVERSLASGKVAKLLSPSRPGRRAFTWYLLPDLEQQRVQVYGVETTDHHRLQDRLRKAGPLEMVGKLAGFVAHDLANNLTVVQGHLGMIQAGQVQGEQVMDSVRQSLRASERAADLVRQLFALRGIETPRMNVVALTSVLGAFSGRLQRLLGEDIELTFQLDPDLPPALTDEGRAQQLLTAAALEVRSGIPAGGTLTVILSRPNTSAAPWDRPAGEHLCLSIVGGGAMESDRSPVQSTLVESLVEQLQGYVEPAQAPEYGLRLYLPAAPRDVDEEGDTVMDPGSGTEMVLLVEDEGPVRSILRMAMERRGYHVVEAATGVEALAVWHRHHDRIALLVTDMVMPVGLSGRELAEKFRIQNPNLRVLYVSGYTAEAAGLPVSLGPGEAYLRKPLDPDELTRAVRMMIDG